MMADVISDTALSCMARFVMLWILRNPSEAINPEKIAEENHISVKQVKALLSELVDAHYLTKPERVQGERGRFDWTPYTLNPSYGQPLNGEPSHGDPVNGQAADGQPGTTEPAHVGDAATREDKELLKEQKETKEIDSKQSQNNSLKLKDTNAPAQNSVIQAQTEDDHRRNFASKSPEVQAFASKALAIAMGHQNAPNPNSARPLPPDLEKDYLDHWGKTAVTGKERLVLFELIDLYGVEGLRAIIKDADTVDPDGKAIRNPAAWIRDTGGKVSKPPRKAVQVTANAQNYDEIFNRDPEPEVDLKPAPEPIDDAWQGLSSYIRTTYPILYGDHFKTARFGGVENGAIRVLVDDMKAYRGCYYTLNHNKQFERWCKDFWPDLSEVIFVIERIANVPTPEQP